jgi:hypothetical protein
MELIIWTGRSCFTLQNLNMEKKPEKQVDKRIIKIAEKLKKMRVAKGYKSYDVFAWDNDISRVNYWRMEKGHNFTMETLLKILDVHKISLEEFFKGLK